MVDLALWQGDGRLLVRLPHAGRLPEFRVQDDKIIFEVGRVVDHEIAVLEWD